MSYKPDKKPEYFFFGKPPQTLLGCYHPPKWDNEMCCGVLLCNPFGHEYIRAYRAYRQLAIKIASGGLHVFRFDYYGCGDSSDDLREARLCHWLENIEWAMEEFKQRGQLKSLFLAGLRLGGSLAVMAAEKRKDVNALILWEPVINGAKYCEELAWQQSRYVASMHREYRSLYKGNPSWKEILGFELTSALATDLKGIDLMSGSKLQSSDILLLVNDSTKDYDGVLDFLKKNQNYPTLEIVEEQKLWLERPYKALVPVRTIQAIISWLNNRVK